MTKGLPNQILEKVNKPADEQQRRVLEFARALAMSAPAGVPGKELLRFGGLISKEGLTKMSAEIEKGCERIDAHEW